MMNGKVYDEKVDVFSFGIILCEVNIAIKANTVTPDYYYYQINFVLFPIL